MYPIIEEYYSSNLGREDFCKAKGIKIATLSYWVTKYRSEKERSQGFIKLDVKPKHQSGAVWMELELTNGTVLRYYEPVTPEYVKGLIQ